MVCELTKILITRDSISGRREFRAMKVLTGMAYTGTHDIFEREILMRLREGDNTDFRYKYISHLLDDFEHEGPNGKHVCLIFELYGETLASFNYWFGDGMLPTDLMKRFTVQLLCALDFAHDHGVIHTGNAPSRDTLCRSI